MRFKASFLNFATVSDHRWKSEFLGGGPLTNHYLVIYTSPFSPLSAENGIWIGFTSFTPWTFLFLWAWLPYNLSWSVCIGYIQAIPATTDKCPHLSSDCRHAMFVRNDFRAKNDETVRRLCFQITWKPSFRDCSLLLFATFSVTGKATIRKQSEMIKQEKSLRSTIFLRVYQWEF